MIQNKYDRLTANSLSKSRKPSTCLSKSESLRQTPTPSKPDDESCLNLNISLVPSQRAFHIDETPNKLYVDETPGKQFVDMTPN